jgi:hypothetical protein
MRKIVPLLVLMFIFMVPAVAYAQNSLRGSFDFVQETILGNAGVKDLQDAPGFIRQVLRLFLSIVAVVALAVLVYGGFLYITSAGEEDKARKAKLLIVYAIFGLLLIGASAIIVNVVINLYKR